MNGFEEAQARHKRGTSRAQAGTSEAQARHKRGTSRHKRGTSVSTASASASRERNDRSKRYANRAAPLGLKQRLAGSARSAPRAKRAGRHTPRDRQNTKTRKQRRPFCLRRRSKFLAIFDFKTCCLISNKKVEIFQKFSLTPVRTDFQNKPNHEGEFETFRKFSTFKGSYY